MSKAQSEGRSLVGKRASIWGCVSRLCESAKKAALEGSGGKVALGGKVSAVKKGVGRAFS